MVYGRNAAECVEGVSTEGPVPAFPLRYDVFANKHMPNIKLTLAMAASDLPKIALVSEIFAPVKQCCQSDQVPRSSRLLSQHRFTLFLQIPGHAESSCTFVIEQEDHTLGNSLRYTLMRK